jgi:hypothetical protein
MLLLYAVGGEIVAPAGVGKSDAVVGSIKKVDLGVKSCFLKIFGANRMIYIVEDLP